VALIALQVFLTDQLELDEVRAAVRGDLIGVHDASVREISEQLTRGHLAKAECVMMENLVTQRTLSEINTVIMASA
jgi:hypothetical protein